MGFNETIEKAGNMTGVVGNVINGVQAVKSLFQNQDKINAKNDARQINQQGKLNEVNAKTSKELADYEQGLKMKMWNDTNYSAQMRQANEAGLSKMAVLGAGGSGTTAQSASVGSGSVGNGASNASATQQADVMSEMAKAQIANLNANTEKQKVEAGKIGGVDSDNAGAELKWKEIQNRIAGATENDTIDIVRNEMNKQIEELKHLKDKTGTNLNTYTERITGIKAEAMGAVIQNAVMKQGIEVDKAKIKEIANNILMRAKELDVTKEGQAVSERNMQELTKAMLIGAGINAVGNLAGDLIGLTGKRGPKGSQTVEGKYQWDDGKGNKGSKRTVDTKYR